MKFMPIIQHSSELDYITTQLLAKACKELAVEFSPIIADEFDFSSPTNISGDDFLYRVSIDDLSKQVEQVLLLNSNVRHFYTDLTTGVLKADNVFEASLIHQKHGLPIIPTIFNLPLDKERLATYADVLGGFPLILKATGGSHGVGVIKIDSLSSLSSIADFLSSKNQDSTSRFILRKYIHFKSHARLITLEDRVIASIEYHKQGEEFRTNVGSELKVTPQDFGEKVNRIAIDSIKMLGWKFGGVDILLDEDGSAWIAEVNLPCFFPRAQEITGIDIAKEIVQYALKR
jgi:RimK family alpha-L-glutamate ligase